MSPLIRTYLYAKAKQLGINASQVAEQAIAEEYASRRAKELRVELEREMDAIEKFVEEHGCFAEMVRAHHGGDDGAI